MSKTDVEKYKICAAFGIDIFLGRLKMSKTETDTTVQNGELNALAEVHGRNITNTLQFYQVNC